MTPPAVFFDFLAAAVVLVGFVALVLHKGEDE